MGKSFSAFVFIFFSTSSSAVFADYELNPVWGSKCFGRFRQSKLQIYSFKESVILDENNNETLHFQVLWNLVSCNDSSRTGFVPEKFTSSSFWGEVRPFGYRKIPTLRENISVFKDRYVLSSFSVERSDADRYSKFYFSLYSSRLPFWMKMSLERNENLFSLTAQEEF